MLNVVFSLVNGRNLSTWAESISLNKSAPAAGHSRSGRVFRIRAESNPESERASDCPAHLETGNAQGGSTVSQGDNSRSPPDRRRLWPRRVGRPARREPHWGNAPRMLFMLSIRR